VMAFAAPALADYVVYPGDVLEITVLGAPGLHRRAAVDAGGQVSVPIVGELDAAGSSLAQLRSKLQDLLREKNIVRNPAVTIDVVDYRPIYVSGDVVKPGAYPFRPGMTVRDAVALAEGYDLLHMRGRDPMLEGADARGDYQTAAVEVAKQTARIARLKAELDNSNELDVKELRALSLKPAGLAEIVQSETTQLVADRENVARDKASLGRLIKTTQDQIAALTREQEQGAAALDQQTNALARAKELMQRGLLQNVRLEDNQRAFAAAQSQLSEVQARTAQARRDLVDYMRRLEAADDQRRIRLMEELREAIAQAATAKYKLEAAADKLRYTGAAQLRRASAAPAEPPEVAIYRKVDGAQKDETASEATALLPGDNVEITTKGMLDKLFLTGTAPDNGAPASARLPSPSPAVPTNRSDRRK
jgi:polysaccharide export outer membrane protein